MTKGLKLAYLIVPLALSGCSGGDTSSGVNYFAVDCLSPSERFIDDFCGGCPQGWTLIPYDADIAGVCCTRPDGNNFWWRGEQCPANTETAFLGNEFDDRGLCFIGWCPPE